ncbi:phosphoheptose isomerase [Herbaspirillum sp. C7C2]|uniref:phosphoheptose isomerase n=1 Tax=Herbaspirillum sp. C7C2 TaxID=2736666 RepID=UPI001F5218EC|nr:phosphoheptose isomerase [Herbaspirillum sp. C7C2]MCI1016740.1 phosphoheptose isomerase [Herbaspirillum sp. C7C2]
MENSRITDHFLASARLKVEAVYSLEAPISDAIRVMSAALAKGAKILSCGNGGSAADSQHFSAELVGRFERERSPLPAVALTTDTSILTAICNDYGNREIFSKQVQALGRNGDILLVFSTSGNSENIVAAVEEAHQQDMTIVALTGKGGGQLAAKLGPLDVQICVPRSRTAYIQEVHLTTLHCLCDGIDSMLFGSESDHDHDS